MMNLLGLLLVVAASFLGSDIAEACMCSPGPTICNNDDLFYARITSSYITDQGMTRSFGAKLLHNFLSDQPMPDYLVITSNGPCGIDLDVGDEYIISGNAAVTDHARLDDTHPCYNFVDRVRNFTQATTKKDEQEAICSESKKRTADTNSQRNIGSVDDESFIRSLLGNGRHIVQRQQSNDWIDKLMNRRQ